MVFRAGGTALVALLLAVLPSVATGGGEGAFLYVERWGEFLGGGPLRSVSVRVDCGSGDAQVADLWSDGRLVSLLRGTADPALCDLPLPAAAQPPVLAPDDPRQALVYDGFGPGGTVEYGTSAGVIESRSFGDPYVPETQAVFDGFVAFAERIRRAVAHTRPGRGVAFVRAMPVGLVADERAPVPEVRLGAAHVDRSPVLARVLGRPYVLVPVPEGEAMDGALLRGVVLGRGVVLEVEGVLFHLTSYERAGAGF